MEEYKSNSYASKAAAKNELAEKPKIGKVVKGSAKARKKGFFEKIFTSEEATNAKASIKQDVIIPSIKKIIFDTIERIIYPDSRDRGRRSTADRFSYNNVYNNTNRREQTPITRTAGGYSYDEVSFESRGDAEAVLDRLCEVVGTYGQVSIADLYEMAELPSRYTDNNYGWKDLGSASVERVRDGYMLKLPRAVPLR